VTHILRIIIRTVHSDHLPHILFQHQTVPLCELVIAQLGFDVPKQRVSDGQRRLQRTFDQPTRQRRLVVRLELHTLHQLQQIRLQLRVAERTEVCNGIRTHVVIRIRDVEQLEHVGGGGRWLYA